MSPDDEPTPSLSRILQIQSEAELGTLPALLLGTIAERRAPGGDIWRYICVGRPSLSVRRVLGWPQENVWLRQAELGYILSKRTTLMSDVPAASAHVLGQQ